MGTKEKITASQKLRIRALQELLRISLISPIGAPPSILNAMLQGSLIGDEDIKKNAPEGNEVAELLKELQDENLDEIYKNFRYNVDIDTEITDFEFLILAALRRTSYSEEEQIKLTETVSHAVDSIIRNRVNRPTYAPELWVDRDPSLKEEPHEFIERVYAKYLESGTLLRADIRKLDDPLNSALARQEKNPKRSPPKSFYLPKQHDSLADDPSLIVKGGTHEGRQASGKKSRMKSDAK